MYSTDELYAQNIDVITQATFTQTVIHACASAWTVLNFFFFNIKHIKKALIPN